MTVFLPIILTTLLPLCGLVWWGWDQYEVALVFWLDGAQRLLLGLGLMWRLPEDVGRLRALVVFIFYSGFTAAHGLLIVVLLDDVGPDRGPAMAIGELAATLYWPLLVAIYAAQLLHTLLSHGAEDRAQTRERARIVMREVHLRTWVVQVGVLLLAALLEQGQSAVSVLAGLLVLRLLLELWSQYSLSRVQGQPAAA